jgi:hypothetical protein
MKKLAKLQLLKGDESLSNSSLERYEDDSAFETRRENEAPFQDGSRIRVVWDSIESGRKWQRH